MLKYHYSPLLLPTSIRLLRLLPTKTDPKYLRGEIFEYPIQNSDKPSHPYEALSYVWGSENKPQSIIIDDRILNITQNLYAALLRLQDHSCSRVIWVDAVCINQTEEKEKEHQISFMTEIYAKASRVLVWLGEAEDDGDRALEAIRLAGEKSTKPSNVELSQQAIPQLLQRQWFRRIWVLQEVAAARHILVLCGSTEIDGHAFCSGLEVLCTTLEDSMTQVAFLIRGAVFRSRHISRKQGRLSLDICSLGELIDMYHAHEAKKSHDRVYALLGMCSDDLSGDGLKPNYRTQWKILMENLVKFILGDQASVTASNDGRAVIKIKGCVFGKVSSVKNSIDLGGGQNVEATFKSTLKQPGCIRDGSARWTLRASAKSLRKGDIICLLQGCSVPTVIRVCEDYFEIILIAAVPPKIIQTKDKDIEWPEFTQSASFARDFLLFWDWETSSEKPQNSRNFDTLMRTTNWQSEHLVGLQRQLDNATRIWNVGLILGDLGEHKNAEEKLREATEGCKIAFGEVYRYTLECGYGLTPLSWAAGNGNDAMVSLLLTKDGVDINLKDNQHGRTPLSYAAWSGHKAVVKLLLETSQVDVNSKDEIGRMPLSRAAEGGHEAVVKLLLETGQVDVDSKDRDGRTPLSRAAEGGHEAVVKLLLETGRVDVDLKDGVGWTPLSRAAEGGHQTVVKLLLETGQVNVDLKDRVGRTPLSRAAIGGHEAVVKLLLETGQVDVDLKDGDGRTPLSWAAIRGHETVIKLLLETDQVDVDLKDGVGWTPLLWAAEGGHEAVVKLLLETGQVDVNVKDRDGRTPLLWAAIRRHEAVVKLLLETSQVDVNLKDRDGRTPLSQAAEEGYEAVVKLLLKTGQVDVNVKDGDGRTPLLQATEEGYEAVVKLLLETGLVNVNVKDGDGWTPLLWAAIRGHEAVVKLLLETGQVDVNLKDRVGRTPLLWAATGGHEAVVKLLQQRTK